MLWVGLVNRRRFCVGALGRWPLSHLAHVVLQGQQARPSGVGRARPPLLARCGGVAPPRTSPRCARAWKRSISWGSCKTMGVRSLAMARSSLVSMVNFHWPLVRGETEIQSVLPGARSESPLYAHRVEMNVKTYLDC